MFIYTFFFQLARGWCTSASRAAPVTRAMRWTFLVSGECCHVGATCLSYPTTPGSTPTASPDPIPQNSFVSTLPSWPKNTGEVLFSRCYCKTMVCVARSECDIHKQKQNSECKHSRPCAGSCESCVWMCLHTVSWMNVFSWFLVTFLLQWAFGVVRGWPCERGHGWRHHWGWYNHSRRWTEHDRTCWQKQKHKQACPGPALSKWFWSSSVKWIKLWGQVLWHVQLSNRATYNRPTQTDRQTDRQTDTHTHTHAHARTHALTYTRTHTDTRTYTRTHTHTHTHTRGTISSPEWNSRHFAGGDPQIRNTAIESALSVRLCDKSPYCSA